MQISHDRQFGVLITRLIQKEDLTREEAKAAFSQILQDKTTAMQQGAFLAALTAKGETAEEVAGSWEAIYELDTQKVPTNGGPPQVENSGTGMDSFKTFNISTAASLIAASEGIPMARHGARAITSVCGTVDMAAALGVDVECSVELVAESIRVAGIGLFNGMSPQTHPMALGRILSQIYFGSTLNIAASLANPALPQIAVRGVYSREVIMPVIEVMKAIGYRRAVVLHGEIDQSDKGMDEASVCGVTHCAELTEDGGIRRFSFRPEDYGLKTFNAADLIPEKDITSEARRFVALVSAKENGARSKATILNAGLIYYVAGQSETIEDGVKQATETFESGRALETLKNWVQSQNTEPEKGLAILVKLV